MILYALTACGGGGGGDTPTASVPTTKPEPTTCPNGELDFPICSAIGKPQQALPSTYAPNSNEYAFFTEWNMVRAKMGMGPVNQNVLIDKAAQNHANYSGWIPGENGHLEVAGRSGFTGEGPAERIRFAGLKELRYASEVMAAGVGKNEFYGLMNAIYHRQVLLNENLTDAGMISTVLSGTIVDAGYVKPQLNNGNFMGMYPYDSETAVTLTHALEYPNPFQGEMEMNPENLCTKTSSAISFLSAVGTELKVGSFTVREYGSNQDLRVRLMKPGNITNPNYPIGLNHAVIIGNAPFKQYQRYEVQFTGKVAGGRSGKGFDVNKTWSFTTGVELNNRCS